jgi:hypothetical protein
VVVAGEVGRSAVYMRYRNGPRTLLWGTQAWIGDRGCWAEPNLTKKCLFSRKDWRRRKKFMGSDCIKLYRRPICQTLSKVWEISWKACGAVGFNSINLRFAILHSILKVNYRQENSTTKIFNEIISVSAVEISVTLLIPSKVRTSNILTFKRLTFEMAVSRAGRTLFKCPLLLCQFLLEPFY